MNSRIAREPTIVAPDPDCGAGAAVILPRKFYNRATVEVARALLGQILVHGERAGRIVEVEAYLGESDPAAHAWHGRTARTEVLYGPPGHAYVYLIYGMHECLNFVAEPEGKPGCVLIRALEPLAGLTAMRRARPGASEADLCRGPGKLTRAMGITRRHYGADLTRGPLTVHEMRVPPGEEIAASPRIGIRRAADLLLRFYLRDNPCVSALQGRR
ncbi:MAG: DNA-3-methyladenine glycosylase [Bryobacteraceae bacterium]